MDSSNKKMTIAQAKDQINVLIKTLNGKEYNNLINTIGENWIGHDANNFLSDLEKSKKDLEKKLKKLKSELKEK